MLESLPNLKKAWTRARYREDISNFKVVYVCIKHFQKEDIDSILKVPKGDGTFTEVLRVKLIPKEGTVPRRVLFGCPAYYSTKSTKRTRLSYDAKEENLMNQTLQLSLRSESE